MYYREGLCWTEVDLRTNVQKLLTLVEMSSDYGFNRITVRNATLAP